MNYYSLNHKAPNASFKDAVIKGLAPDKGLYFPESITPLPKSFFENIDNLSHSEIAFEAIKQFVSPDIPEDILKQMNTKIAGSFDDTEIMNDYEAQLNNAFVEKSKKTIKTRESRLKRRL